jgi:hypothetical protein
MRPADIDDVSRLLVGSRRLSPLSETRSFAGRGSSSPRPDAAEHDDTNTRHKTHSTELEVHYPWHPWFGLKVTTHRSCTRQGVACVSSALERDGRLLRLEIPGWMFDRATCAAMSLAEHPSVGVTHLQALKQLLPGAAGTGRQNLIETQHLDSSRKGDADEEKENATPHPTRPISTTSGHADLVDPPPRSAAESSEPARATVSRDPRLSRPLPKKGGGR